MTDAVADPVESLVATEHRVVGVVVPEEQEGRWPRAWSSSLAGSLYVALGFALWWHAWSASPSGTMTCDCADAGRMVWYLAWVPFALGHGHSLLFSTFQFHPHGFGLLTDTSVLALGVLVSPVTVLFGPVVSINLLSTLIPSATAFAMYCVLLRWVRWAPAAFVGGLAYGFSVWVVIQLGFGWLNLACVALLPLMAACLDELLIRQRRRAATVGAALALLLVTEFFVSVEMALLVVLSAVLASLVIVGWAWLVDRSQLRSRFRHGATGVAVAAAGAAVLLAYPVWVFVAGPGHLSGSVWTNDVPGSLGNTIGNLWDPIGQYGSLSSKYLAELARSLGGFGGPAGPSPSYLGWGILAVLAAGVVLWRRDRRLWLFGVVGLITFALSLTVGSKRWGPWSVLDHVPLMLNVSQYRFAGIFVLCATAMLAIVLDRLHDAAVGWLGDRSSKTRGAQGGDRHVVGGRGSTAVRAVAAALVLLVAAVTLMPEINVLAPDLPITMRPVTVPPWFTTVAPGLRAGTVVATYPFTTSDSQASIPWQAIAGLPYQMAGGGGPSGTIARAGPETRGFAVLNAASVINVPAPKLDRANLVAVRAALADWGVTMVVVPNDAGLPRFQIARGSTYGVMFFTAVLRSAPTYEHGAWVWADVQLNHAP